MDIDITQNISKYHKIVDPENICKKENYDICLCGSLFIALNIAPYCTFESNASKKHQGTKNYRTKTAMLHPTQSSSVPMDANEVNPSCSTEGVSSADPDGARLAWRWFIQRRRAIIARLKLSNDECLILWVVKSTVNSEMICAFMIFMTETPANDWQI